MIRATTPRHVFVFEDINPEENFASILVTYAQNDQIVLEKTKDDLEFSTETCGKKQVYIASYRLTQEETKLFSSKPRNVVDVQVRALTHAGDVYASDKRSITVQDVLNDEVLV